MADDARDRTGPLSAQQLEILGHAMRGLTHEQIGQTVVPNKHKAHVSQILMSTTAKMGCRKVTEAIYRYATHLAYLEAAAMIEADCVKQPLGDAEEHVNYVLEELADILRSRAATLLPQQ